MNLKTILIVDDDPLNIKVINDIVLEISPPKYEVLNASNASLALKIAKSVAPDLIVTDWEMPEMNGIEFIRKLKEDPQTREIPVIMASGIMINSEDLDLALSSGAIDYIRKPIDKIEFIARVRTVLELSEYVQEIKNQKEVILKQQEEIHQLDLLQLSNELTSKEQEVISGLNFLTQNENEKRILLEIIESLKPHLSEQGKSILRSAMLDVELQKTQTSLVELEHKFDQINTQFYEKLSTHSAEITKNEKVLAAYMAMNLSPTEIAHITKKSLNSVNVAFSRIRNKLDIPDNKALKLYLVNLKSS
ncbi:MAG: hypothetical protein CL840_19605 [Crocinitomicaceae bacterium]|nr:hypothetical protein [Crocinitomicaceae bacterium]|tara:strand:- start:5200 stop:6114 length:915 start_codon:yes stop_codon:yes gene_type:complete